MTLKFSSIKQNKYSLSHDGCVCQKFRSSLYGSGSGSLWLCNQSSIQGCSIWNLESDWRINLQGDSLPWCLLLARIHSSSTCGLLHRLLGWKGAWLCPGWTVPKRARPQSILWPSLGSYTLQFLYYPIGNWVKPIPFGRRLHKGVKSSMRGLLGQFTGWLQTAKSSFLLTMSRFSGWAAKFLLLWSLHSGEDR